MLTASALLFLALSIQDPAASAAPLAPTPEPKPTPDGPVVAVETTMGTFQIAFYASKAPASTRNIMRYMKNGFYVGTIFHRVIPGFVAQGGCPNGTGTGGPDWSIACETKGNRHKHIEGSLSMAHAGRDTGGSQFFLVLDPQPHLDGIHTVFGQIVDGLDVLQSLEVGDEINHIRFE